VLSIFFTLTESNRIKTESERGKIIEKQSVTFSSDPWHATCFSYCSMEGLRSGNRFSRRFSMKLFKKLLAGIALAAATVSAAQAAPINVGGVVWNPDAPLDFSGTTATLSQFIDPDSGVLSGFGVITTINGTGVGAFCPGCELTVEYGGYTPVGGAVIPDPTLPNSKVFYSGGFVKVYVDHTPNADPFDPLALTSGTVTDGNLWLSLVGHAINGITLTGTVIFDPTETEFTHLLGTGFWDVIGGLAMGNMNTNTRADGSDFSFSNSFTSLQDGVFLSTGTGNFKGNSVPEPGSLLLMSLGLLAFASTRYRKSQ
jgi:hypothetical protein